MLATQEPGERRDGWKGLLILAVSLAASGVQVLNMSVRDSVGERQKLLNGSKQAETIEQIRGERIARQRLA